MRKQLVVFVLIYLLCQIPWNRNGMSKTTRYSGFILVEIISIYCIRRREKWKIKTI